MNPFQDLTDEKLMILYQKGESMAFEVLYQRHKDKVHQYLSRRLENRNDLEEVFQGVFLKLHKSRDSYDDRYLFLQWMYTITKSQYIDFKRKRNLPTEILNFEVASQEKPESNLDLNEISSLNRDEKKAIGLRFYEGFDYDEIASQIGKSQSNARKIVSRGLAKIRKSMKIKGSL